MTLGEKIRRMRYERGETLGEFGKRFKPRAADSIVSRWENNISKPTAMRMIRLAEISGTTVDELLSEEKTEPELTEVEKKIIECYRNGASLNVAFHTHSIKSLDDAYEKANIYGIKHITDFTGGLVSFVDFGNKVHERVEFNTFLGVNRK